MTKEQDDIELIRLHKEAFQRLWKALDPDDIRPDEVIKQLSIECKAASRNATEAYLLYPPEPMPDDKFSSLSREIVARLQATLYSSEEEKEQVHKEIITKAMKLITGKEGAANDET